MDDDIREDGDRDALEEVAQVLSHDLSNLLVIAQSSLELARRNDGDDEHVERTAAILENAEELVDDVVTLAQTGQQAADVEPTPLKPVAERAWQSVGAPCATLEIADSHAIAADQGWLRLLLENLFQNAVEHGAPDAASALRVEAEDGSSAQPPSRDGDPAAVTVEVGLIERDGAAGFYVADDGPGFSPDDPDRPFESGFSTQEERSGLGLTIVRRIADAHGWTTTLTESATGGERADGSRSSDDEWNESSGGARIEFTGVQFEE